MMFLHYLSIFLYPLPEALSLLRPEDVKEYVNLAPVGALLCVMFAHLSGALAGGFSASFIGTSKWPIFCIGIFFTLAGIYNLYTLPHPLWFTVETLFYIPSSILGYKIKTCLYSGHKST